MPVSTLDLVLAPAPGLPRGLVIPASELTERFSRSSGPGGQGVNTTDSRVELLFSPQHSATLSASQRRRVEAALGDRLVDGHLVIAASEQRSQRQNRAAARERLAVLLTAALAPPPPPRRPTRPTRGSTERRITAKKQRAGLKARRRRVSGDDG